MSLGKDSAAPIGGMARTERLATKTPATVLNLCFRYASFMATREAPDNESLRLELQEAIVSYRQWASQLTQIAGFTATGDVLLISYGFSQKLAAILLFASAFPVVILAMYLFIGSINIPLIGLMLRIERKLLIREDASLGAMFLRDQQRSVAPAVGAIEELSDEEMHRLNLSLSRRKWIWTPVPVILYIATIAQVGIFVLSLTVFDYRFM